jgi:hypothetical protein
VPSVLSILTPIVAACAVTAWILVRRRWPAYRPVALALTCVVGADLLRAALQEMVLRPARASLGDAPYQWPVAGAYHLEQALQLSLPLTLVLAATAVFARRPAWVAVIGAWGALSAGFAVAYPWLRLERRDTAHAMVHTGALLLIAALGARSLREYWHRVEHWRAWHWAIGYLLAIEVGVAVSVTWWDAPGLHWEIARRIQQVAYAGLLAYQCWRLSR